MDRPRICVDFNEMLERDLVLLSKDDSKSDSEGNLIEMVEGTTVHIYENDTDRHGNPDYMIASGVIERNTAVGWSSNVPWCCRIDENEIRHASEVYGND